jgi:hypothetical protein
MSNLTPAQMAWLRKHAEYSPIGRPRPGTRFDRVGILHGEGTFESAKPSRPGFLLMQAIKLRPDGMSIGVGVRMVDMPFPG